jgi:hypothetical protein
MTTSSVWDSFGYETSRNRRGIEFVLYLERLSECSKSSIESHGRDKIDIGPELGAASRLRTEQRGRAARFVSCMGAIAR